MTQAYRIIEWQEYYEVTDKGKPALIDTRTLELRKSKLPYIRWKNKGHNLSPAFRKLNKEAWRLGPLMGQATFGLFGKLLELAGDQNRQFRGWILDEKQQPMTAADIAFLFEWDEDAVSKGLSILTSPTVRWVEFATIPMVKQVTPPKFPQIPGIPGKRGKLQKETEGIQKVYEIEENTSGYAPDVSDSGKPVSQVQTDVKIGKQDSAAREDAIKEVCRLLRVGPNDKGNITTMRDIFEQVQEIINSGQFNAHIYERVVDEAKEVVSHRFGKWGRFINAMKREPFNYQPVKREIIGGYFRR